MIVLQAQFSKTCMLLSKPVPWDSNLENPIKHFVKKVFFFQNVFQGYQAVQNSCYRQQGCSRNYCQERMVGNFFSNIFNPKDISEFPPVLYPSTLLTKISDHFQGSLPLLSLEPMCMHRQDKKLVADCPTWGLQFVVDKVPVGPYKSHSVFTAEHLSVLVVVVVQW